MMTNRKWGYLPLSEHLDPAREEKADRALAESMETALSLRQRMSELSVATNRQRKAIERNHLAPSFARALGRGSL